MNVSGIKVLRDKIEGEFGKNRKHTEPLKYLVNINGIFEYGTQLALLDVPYVIKMFSRKPWCLEIGENI